MKQQIHPSKPVVLLAYGGESPEHEVSIVSATNVYEALDASVYDILLCYIDVHGAWWLTDAIKPTHKRALTPLLGQSAVECEGQRYRIDVLFPVLHGEHGEDGTVQGLAKLLHVPIVGCGIASSSMCIDKGIAKQLLDYNDIPIVPFVVCGKESPVPDYTKLSKELGTTLFVKPARLGSSVGVSKVTNEDEFHAALQTAFDYDSKVLIEAGITARELEVAAFGHNQTPMVSVVGEIIPDREFYSFEAKYDEAAVSQVKVPADIPENVSQQIRTYAQKAFMALECEGLSRIDFFLDPVGKIYLNEINTLPGFTGISMYPQLMQHAGMTYAELLTGLIELARTE